MAKVFEFVGKISLGKETEKFKPIKTSKSAKGWLGTRLNFSMFNSTGYHNLEMFEGYMENGSTVIYCLGKDKGADNKLPKLQIKWADRFKQELIDQVVGFNKFVLELGEEKREFLAGSDFLQALIEVLKNESYKDQKFLVEGNVEYTSWNGKVYRKFVPKTVKTVPNDVPDQSIVQLDMFYGQDSLEKITDDKYVINGWVQQYDSTLKRQVPFKEEVVIDSSKAQTEKQKRAFELITNRFMVSDESIMKLGVKTVMINGREKVDIKLEDLTDEERELIDIGLATFEEIASEYGGSTNGDKISEMKVIGFGRGYNKGAQKTDFTLEDFTIVDATDEIVDTTSDVVDEVFEDDDLPF